MRRARPIALAPILGLLAALASGGTAGALNAADAGSGASLSPEGADYLLLSADGQTSTYGRADVTTSPNDVDAGDAAVCVAQTPDGSGAWTVTADGDVLASGTARPLGDLADGVEAGAIAALAATPSGDGYWVVTTAGRVTAFGDARSYGSPEMALDAPVVGMATTATGDGYWLVAADGGIFAFGDARYHGSTAQLTLAQPVVGMAATPTGDGYWLVAADGGVFAFGDARYHGSTAQLTLAQPVVGMAATPTGDGYWLAAADGGVFAFGDAPFPGSQRTSDPGAAVVGIATARGSSCHAASSEQTRVDDLLAWFGGTASVPFGVVVADLRTGVTSAIGADDTFRSASLYKLFVADLVYQDVAAGAISLDQDAGRGTGRSVDDCLDLMITISDNACGIALGSLVGWSARNDDLRAQGFTGTDLTDGNQTTTAGDVALLFEELAGGTLLDPTGTAAFLDLLADQQVNDRLPVGLDPDVASIAHKTGNLDGFVHDAGIVTTPDRRYVIAVLSGPWPSEGQAPPVFAALSAAVYDTLER